MIATLVVVRRARRRCRGWRCCWPGARSPAARCSSPCSCRSCCASRRTCASRSTSASAHVRTVVAQLRAGVHQPRRRAGQRVHRRAAREPAADRRRHRAVQRAAALHAAGQPVRHVGLRGGAAGDVGRRGVDAAGTKRCGARLDAGLRQIAFFVVPSAMAFLALGDVIAAALLQTGRFRHDDAVYVWGILAGSAVGLLASTLGRLYSSTYYALRDTRTPLRYALVRVVLTTVLGYLFAIPLPRWLGVRAAVGRRRADRVGRRRRLGRDAAAAPHAERAHRPDRAAGGLRRQAVGRGGWRAPRSRGPSSSRCRGSIRSSPRCSCSGPTASCSSRRRSRSASAKPRSRSTARRDRRHLYVAPLRCLAARLKPCPRTSMRGREEDAMRRKHARRRTGQGFLQKHGLSLAVGRHPAHVARAVPAVDPDDALGAFYGNATGGLARHARHRRRHEVPVRDRIG